MTLLSVATAAVAAGVGCGTARADPVLTTLASFDGTHGSFPSGPLACIGGQVYGTTTLGGPSNSGTVYRMPVGGGPISDVVTFGAASTGTYPGSGVVADAAGNLYGTTDDAEPYENPTGYGSVFKIPNGTTVAAGAGAGTITYLRTFTRLNGFSPSGLTADAAGNLYGTTSYGGAANGTTLTDNGLVFKVAGNTTPSSRNLVSTVVTFPATGNHPTAGLTIDRAGNLYGVLFGYGTTGYAQIYEIPAGSAAVNVLATVPALDANEIINGNLTLDAAGNLYGTTFETNNPTFGGSVYRIAAGTRAFTRLASFSPAIGNESRGSPIIDAAGDLFGTSTLGGSGSGTVWELPAGSSTLTAVFTFSGTNGLYPSSPLTADAAGNLFGTTSGDGTISDGTVFELTGTGFVVPEPATLSVLAVAGLPLLGRRQRRDRH